jgi:hypothetical protein
MGTDVPCVDGAAEQRGKRRVACFPGTKSRLSARSLDAGREPKAQEVHQGKHMVGEAGRVRIAFFDPQIGFRIEQAVQHIGGIAHADIDDLGMKGRVLKS